MADWTWKELEFLWAHPDWTAREIGEHLGRTVDSVKHQRSRSGRYVKAKVPTCCRCDERPVWMESRPAKRYQLCKGCWLDEERMRLEDAARHAAMRQMRRRRKR